MRFRLPLVLAASAALLLPAAAHAAADPTQPAQAPSATQAAPEKHKAPVKPRRAAKRYPPGYGFLPGYEPPPVDRFGSPMRGGPGYRYSWEGGRYWYRGNWYYGWGGPGFYRGRWNGGSFGPCYNQTPIGPMWNCGH